MKIQLLEPEIKLAIEIYIKSRIKFDAGSHLEIEFTAGRNPPAVSADIDIVEDGTTKDPASLEGLLPEEDTEKKEPFSDTQNNLPFTSSFLEGD
jgi:hypothetical protein